MSAAAPPPLLRPGLLDGVVVAVAPGEGRHAAGIAARCEDLGAAVARLEDPGEDEQRAADQVGVVLAAQGRLDALVWDGAEAFGRAGGAGGQTLDALRACCDGAWTLARAAAVAAWIGEERAGGKVVLIAPGPRAGPHAHATRAGLENMARTLSIEWARYAIRTAAIAPGDGTAQADVHALVAYLASPAGDYFSGCLLELGAVTPAGG